MQHLYPVMLDLTGKRVLIVGAGPVSFKKAEGFVAAGANVTVVSPEFIADFDQLSVTRIVRTYEVGDLAGTWLVITATNNPTVQQQIFDDGERLGIWVNAADEPSRCAFILPAVHRDGPIIVTVSTSGSAPAFAGWLRDRAAASLPKNVVALARQLRAERDAVHAEGRTTEGLNWRKRIEELMAQQQS
jgi:precorrin-2 dehydrogenase / sirohydrochlorin ferrochelatase